MNWLDYVLLAILAYSVLQSFRRGFTREIIGMIAAVAALALGMWFYASAGALVRPWVGSDHIANLLGFLIVVFAVLILGAAIGFIVRRFVRAVGLSFFDRLLGAGFGLIRGMFITIALLTAYIAFGHAADSKTAPAGVVNSQIAPYIMEASRVAVAAAPMALKQSFHEEYGIVKTEIRDLASSNTKDGDGKNK